jgi:preprotein translocase subunit SecF
MFQAIVLYVSMIFAWDFSIGSWGSNKLTDPFLRGSVWGIATWESTSSDVSDGKETENRYE